MVNSLKSAGVEVLRNIPRGAGVAIGAAMAAGAMAGLAKLFTKGSEAIKARTDKKEVVKEATTYATAA